MMQSKTGGSAADVVFASTTADPIVTTGQAVDLVVETTTTTTHAVAPQTAGSEDAVADAIASVQAEPSYVHVSAEHLEQRVVTRLVYWGHDLEAATRAVRARLY